MGGMKGIELTGSLFGLTEALICLQELRYKRPLTVSFVIATGGTRGGQKETMGPPRREKEKKKKKYRDQH